MFDALRVEADAFAPEGPIAKVVYDAQLKGTLALAQEKLFQHSDSCDALEWWASAIESDAYLKLLQNVVETLLAIPSGGFPSEQMFVIGWRNRFKEAQPSWRHNGGDSDVYSLFLASVSRFLVEEIQKARDAGEWEDENTPSVA